MSDCVVGPSTAGRSHVTVGDWRRDRAANEVGQERALERAEEQIGQAALCVPLKHVPKEELLRRGHTGNGQRGL